MGSAGRPGNERAQGVREREARCRTLLVP